MAVQKERRIGLSPLPDDLLDTLSTVQLATFRRMEAFGWQLKFARRPTFQSPVLVLYSAEEGRHSLLEADGSLLPMSEIRLRPEETVTSAVDQ